MPMVRMKKFPYTAKGEKDAKIEAIRTGKPIKRADKKAVAKKSAK